MTVCDRNGNTRNLSCIMLAAMWLAWLMAAVIVLAGICLYAVTCVLSFIWNAIHIAIFGDRGE